MTAQDFTPKISDFITNEVQAVTDFLDALYRLQALSQLYEDNGYFTLITQDHILGDNVHMTPALIANVFTSWSAINTFMESNFHDDVLAQAAR